MMKFVGLELFSKTKILQTDLFNWHGGREEENEEELGPLTESSSFKNNGSG